MSAEPIKRSKALLPLSREHHVDLLLAWKIRKGLNNHTEHRRMADYVRYLEENLMDGHFSDEEKLLFDLLPQEDEMCTPARNDHKQIRYLIAEICERKKDDDHLFRELSDLVEAHVRYEERELFPYLETKLSFEKLEEMEKILSAKHDVFNDTWQDTFWIE
jgi:hemerythrin-like domain-containing protein